MAIRFEFVDGCSFAGQASAILEDSWAPPAIRYSPEYVAWQLSFKPRLPCVAAFEDGEVVGFAGATSRHLRGTNPGRPFAVVSFVAVRPPWRHQGVATGLYRKLLGAVRDLAMPVVTFATAGSAGEKAIERAYPQAGLALQTLGSCNNYAYMPRNRPTDEEWLTRPSDDWSELSDIVDELSTAEALVSDPDRDEFEHTRRDPRPRALMVARNQRTGDRGAAWVVRSEVRTPRGVSVATTVDSIWMRSSQVAGLSSLLSAAATLWHDGSAMPEMVLCPNLSTFETGALRSAGIRQTGASFNSFLAAGATSYTEPPATKTNLAIT